MNDYGIAVADDGAQAFQRRTLHVLARNPAGECSVEGDVAELTFRVPIEAAGPVVDDVLAAHVPSADDFVMLKPVTLSKIGQRISVLALT